MEYRNPLEIVSLLSRHPGMTQKEIQQKTGWSQRTVSDVLGELELSSSGKGGRTSPRRYSIKLPAQKRRALEL